MKYTVKTLSKNVKSHNIKCSNLPKQSCIKFEYKTSQGIVCIKFEYKTSQGIVCDFMHKTQFAGCIKS